VAKIIVTMMITMRKTIELLRSIRESIEEEKKDRQKRRERLKSREINNNNNNINDDDDDDDDDDERKEGSEEGKQKKEEEEEEEGEDVLAAAAAAAATVEGLRLGRGGGAVKMRAREEEVKHERRMSFVEERGGGTVMVMTTKERKEKATVYGSWRETTTVGCSGFSMAVNVDIQTRLRTVFDRPFNVARMLIYQNNWRSFCTSDYGFAAASWFQWMAHLKNFTQEEQSWVAQDISRRLREEFGSVAKKRGFISPTKEILTSAPQRRQQRPAPLQAPSGSSSIPMSAVTVQPVQQRMSSLKAMSKQQTERSIDEKQHEDDDTTCDGTIAAFHIRNSSAREGYQ